MTLTGRGRLPCSPRDGFRGSAVVRSIKRQARINALRKQLPEAFELMGRAVRAGQTMSVRCLWLRRS